MVIAVKQSEKSKQTDIKVAESAARAVRTVGVDQMALTRVAADAGFSRFCDEQRSGGDATSNFGRHNG